MYLGSWKTDDLLTFTVNTHSPTTGAAADADSVPSYRVYEDETGTAILSGSMAKLDDANTTGFYSEQITLSAANGFEKGKCYTIYISAAVGSVTGTMHHTFQIEAEVDANSVGATVDANLVTWQSETPNSLISGRVDVNVGANIVEETRVDGAITQGGQTTAFTTNLSETQDDKYVGWRFAYTGVGTNNAVTRIVEAYNGTTKAITLNRALPASSTLGHSFVLWSDEVLTPAGVNAEMVDVLRTDTIPDSYAADGAQPTMAQALLMILQFLTEKGVSGTTVTVKKPDGSTSAMTFTLNDGSSPSSITRAS